MSLPPNTVANNRFRTVAIIGKHGASGSQKALRELADFLAGHGHEVVFEADTARDLGYPRTAGRTPDEIGQQADVAVVVGGDGTVLGMARLLAPYDVPLIGVNQGRLGFMTDIPLEGMQYLVADMLAGSYLSERRTLLEGGVWRNGERIFQSEAFNDIVVRSSGSGMLELRVEVDGHFMYNQRSDGLIVSTPTGSTAYALSAGGPILHPALGGLVMVSISPHALSNRPIVLSDGCEIVIEMATDREASVNFDMQALNSLQQHDRIVVRRSRHAITFLHPRGWSYYDTLREKLHWNEYPSVVGQLK